MNRLSKICPPSRIAIGITLKKLITIRDSAKKFISSGKDPDSISKTEPNAIPGTGPAIDITVLIILDLTTLEVVVIPIIQKNMILVFLHLKYFIAQKWPSS